MTYCVGVLVRDGLAMLADTRTNAGVDSISSYRKLRIFGGDGERLIAVASAGSLSTTQCALDLARNGLPARDSGRTESILTAPSIHRVAYLLGQAVHATRRDLECLKQTEVDFDATLLVGGAVAGERTRLFLVYGAGNFIECEPDTPFLQIGETKYGKPILDRALNYETGLAEALKVALISFTSTMRSNLAVGLPIDVLTAAAGACVPALVHRVEKDDAYFRDLNDRWSKALKAAQGSIPAPPYG